MGILNLREELQYAWDHRSEKSHIRKARGIVSL
jgi:hypothetical protein